ncbi:hypothetical protein ABTZ58_06975 [Streptomyces sp. NPDC094143]|uniref:hypothetical protein n=1 Tax=Streptomyces sp. NPDC094143 TaxID=3155310 RepID=UPI0033316B6C
MTHEHTVITATDIEQHRAALCAWAEANGIDPKTIALSPFTICTRGDHAVIEYRAFLVDEEGRRLFDRDEQDALTVTRTARLVSPLAAHGLDAGDLGR